MVTPLKMMLILADLCALYSHLALKLVPNLGKMPLCLSMCNYEVCHQVLFVVVAFEIFWRKLVDNPDSYGAWQDSKSNLPCLSWLDLFGSLLN